MEAHQKRGVALSALGLALLLGGGSSAADIRYRLSPARFIVNPMALAVAPDESRIFLGSSSVMLHAIDASGRIENDWQLPTDGGPFRVAVGTDGRVRVATAATGLVLEYAADGTELARTEDSGAFESFQAVPADGVAAESGNRYAIEAGALVRITPQGREVVVNGFASHRAMTAQLALAGVCLFGGVVLVITGIVATGRRASDTPA